MYGSFLNNLVPPNWKAVGYPSLRPLSSWMKDLLVRVEFMREWILNSHPPCYWLSGFFFPHGFMTGTLQTYARKHKKAIDLLSFSFKVMPWYTAAEVPEEPEDGIYIYGLYIEGARWSDEEEILEEQRKGEMYSNMPIILFLPKERHEPDPSDYQ
jgi:dynein heavy chain